MSPGAADGEVPPPLVKVRELLQPPSGREHSEVALGRPAPSPTLTPGVKGQVRVAAVSSTLLTARAPRR